MNRVTDEYVSGEGENAKVKQVVIKGRGVKGARIFNSHARKPYLSSPSAGRNAV